MRADYERTGDGRFIWPAHFAGVTREYCQIEKLANLDLLPAPHGFYVSCLPVKIAGARDLLRNQLFSIRHTTLMGHDPDFACFLRLQQRVHRCCRFTQANKTPPALFRRGA
jgi:hypothetical protein